MGTEEDTGGGMWKGTFWATQKEIHSCKETLYAGEGMSRTVAQRQEHAGVATSPKGQWPMEEATREQVLP